jgi:quinoprotein glucose dehydrogenase
MERYILIFFFLLCLAGCQNQGQPTEAGSDWPVYLGGNSSAQYSPLDQINSANVSQLRPAWEYATGDVDSLSHTQIQCNPIIIDGMLYGTTPALRIFALDAATGRQRWRFDPDEEIDFARNVNRGVTFWQRGNDKRILFTAGPQLICLNADSGLPVESFGSNGRVSLKTGLGERAQELHVVSTSPGIVHGDKIIMGTRVSENANAAPGYIQAFNVKTGALEWVFHTIPLPGEYGYDTWPTDAYQNIGGVNAWAGMALDEAQGVVYVPTGSASFDFYGGNRHGENLFANCVLALDANTGKRLWHFQTVHHDLWDRDLPAPPVLVKVDMGGKQHDALAQITKTGYVFLLDRHSGEPLFPVEERPVPASDLAGEVAWPTQPVPVKPPPFARQLFDKNEITNRTPEAHDFVTRMLDSLPAHRPFLPPSKEGSIIYPGFDGGGEWGGPAYDPETGILYVNANEMPWILTMVETANTGQVGQGLGDMVYQATCAMCHGKDREGDATGTYPSLQALGERLSAQEVMQVVNNGRGFMPGYNHLPAQKKEALVKYLLGKETETIDAHAVDLADNATELPYSHTGYNRFLDQDGYPAIKPPWGTLTAIDLGQGSIKWQVPLGEYPELTVQGMAKTGTENYGGPVATAGGLIFIGASKDEYFRAFDSSTGEELWKYKLPAGGYATPSVYAIDGRQYVVIACGGGKMGTKSGDRYVAFALPNDGQNEIMER